MIRWSYLVPRLVLLAVAIVLVWLGLDPLLRSTMIRLGERTLGAKIRIGELKTSLAAAGLRLRDVQVANPQEPMKNLFEAAEIRLNFDTGTLLHRKFVVGEGSIKGLRLNTERTTPGTVDRKGGLLDLLPDDLAVRIDPGRLAEFGQAWLDRFALAVKREIAEDVEQLQSVRLARELSRRWPAELGRMEVRADEIKTRADRLQALAQKGGGDPLKNLEHIERIISDVESLEREIAEFRSEVQRLRQQADKDRDAVVAARDQDLRQLREQFRLDELESGGLSELLLGQELAERIRTLAAVIRRVRGLLPRDAEDQVPNPIRARGIDVVFAGLAPQPDFLIRTLAIEGEGSARGRKLQFQGTAQGLTSQPALYGQPAVLSVTVQGPVAMQIEALLDHTRPVPRDCVNVECPCLVQPKRLLGRPGQLAMTVSPGTARISIQLELSGDDLIGQLSIRQEPVELVPEIAAQYGGRALADKLQAALRETRLLDATADLSGTLDKPQWKLRSNLGAQLARAFQELLRHDLETRRDELVQLVQTKVDAEMARFQQMFLAKQQDLLARVQRSGLDVQQLQDLASRRAAPLNRVLDKAFRGGNPLRF